MSFWSSSNDTKNHHHHQHHDAKNPKNWEASNERFQGAAAFNNGYEYFPDAPLKNYQDQEHEKPLVCVKVGNQEICKESVDDVTEEFIKLEHKRFGYNKWMSTG